MGVSKTKRKFWMVTLTVSDCSELVDLILIPLVHLCVMLMLRDGIMLHHKHTITVIIIMHTNCIV